MGRDALSLPRAHLGMIVPSLMKRFSSCEGYSLVDDYSNGGLPEQGSN